MRPSSRLRRLLLLLAVVSTLCLTVVYAGCKQSSKDPCRVKPTLVVSDTNKCSLSTLKFSSNLWHVGYPFETDQGTKCCTAVRKEGTLISKQLHCGDGGPIGYELQAPDIMKVFPKTLPQALIHVPIDQEKLDISKINTDGRIYIMDAHGSFHPEHGDGIPKTTPDVKPLLARLSKAAIQAGHIKVIFILSCSADDEMMIFILSCSADDEMKKDILEKGKKEKDIKTVWKNEINKKLKPERLLVCDSEIKKTGLLVLHANPLHLLTGHTKLTWKNLGELVDFWKTFSSDQVRTMSKFLAKTDIDETDVKKLIETFGLLKTEDLSEYNKDSKFHYCMLNNLDNIAETILFIKDNYGKKDTPLKYQVVESKIKKNSYNIDDAVLILQDYIPSYFQG